MNRFDKYLGGGVRSSSANFKNGIMKKIKIEK